MGDSTEDPGTGAAEGPPSGHGPGHPKRPAGSRRRPVRDVEPGAPGIPYRVVPERPWSRLLVVAAVLTVVALTGWELFARSMHHTPGSYMDAGLAWAAERGKLDDPDRDVRVVLAGSSRMLWAADLDILEEGLGTRPIQLALPGTSPRVIVEHLVSTTDFDGLILVGYTPFLFNDPMSGFMGQTSIDAYEDNRPSKLVGHHLHRFLSDHFGFLDQAFGLFGLVERYASPRLPERPGSENLNAGLWKLGNLYDDRQMDMWEPIETPGSFDWQQVTNFWMGGEDEMSPPPPPEALAEMTEETNAFFAPLVAEMRARGGDIVFVRMPSSGEYRQRELESALDSEAWPAHVEGLDALSINGWDYPELSTELEIPEWSHLSRRSQDDWSRALVPILEERYEAFRGVSLYEMLGVPAPERGAPPEGGA